MEKVIEAIRQLLVAQVQTASNLLEGVKAVYWGDPIQIPLSSLPALVIQPVATDYVEHHSRDDIKKHTVEIRLVDNIKNYIGSAQNANADHNLPTKVGSVEKAVQAIEQVSTSHQTAASSVCGVIAQNPSLPYTEDDASYLASELAQVRRVDYVFNSARGFPTFEVIVTVDAMVKGLR